MRHASVFITVLCALLSLAARPAFAGKWNMHDTPSTPSFVSSATCLSPKSCFLLGSFDTNEARLFYSADQHTWVPVKSAPVFTTGLLASHPAGALLMASSDPTSPGAFVCAVETKVSEAVASFAPGFGVSVLCIPIDVEGAAMSVRRMPSYAKSPYMFAVVTRPPYVPPSSDSAASTPNPAAPSGKLVLVSNGDTFTINLPRQGTGVTATHAYPLGPDSWALLTASDFSAAAPEAAAVLDAAKSPAERVRATIAAAEALGAAKDKAAAEAAAAAADGHEHEDCGAAAAVNAEARATFSYSEDGGKTWSPKGSFDGFATDLDCVSMPTELCFVSLARRTSGASYAVDAGTGTSELRLDFNATSVMVAGVRARDNGEELVALAGGFVGVTANALQLESSDRGRNWVMLNQMGIMPHISIEMTEDLKTGVAVGFTGHFTPALYFYE